MKTNPKLNSLALAASVLILFFLLFSSTAFAVSPAVTAVAPPSGPNTGGNQVVIEESGFTGATEMDFGTVVISPSNFTVLDDGVITVYAPPKTARTTVNIKVTSPIGTSVPSSGNEYTYVAAAPQVTGISLHHCKIVGGHSVNITETSFIEPIDVNFGTTVVPPTNFQVINDSMITMKTPKAPAGSKLVDITSVTTPADMSDTSAADKCRYDDKSFCACPEVYENHTITKISPPNSPIAGK